MRRSRLRHRRHVQAGWLAQAGNESGCSRTSNLLFPRRRVDCACGRQSRAPSLERAARPFRRRLHWPRGLDEPVLDGRRLIFSAPELELQEAWDAVKARVAATNLAYREQFPPGEQEADRRGDPEV